MKRSYFRILIFILFLTSCGTRITDTPPATTTASSPPTSVPTPQASPSPPGWTRSNPGGGGAFAAVGAGPTGIILAGSDLSGAYVSRDRGETWSPIGYANGLVETHISSVGFDTQDGNILYLGTGGGIYRSDNAGETMHQVLDGGYILDIQFSLSNPNIGYASSHPDWNGNNGQIFKTTDRGRTWSQVSTDLPDDLRITKLIMHPADENSLYFLSGGSRFSCGANGLYKSTDGGVTWTELASDLPDIEDIAINKLDPNILYFTTFAYVSEGDGHGCQTVSSETGELYQSMDAGATWSMITHKSGSIWTDSDDPHTIRLIASYRVESDELSGMWETTDDGVSWNKIGDISIWEKGWSDLIWTFSGGFDGSAHTFGEDLSDPNALLWVNSQFAWVTRDKGRHFDNIDTQEIAPGQWQSTGFDNIVMFDLSIGADSQDIYTGSYDIGCWHSPNAGISWLNCNDPQTTTVIRDGYESGWQGYGGNTTTILADPTRSGVVWASQTSDLSDPHILLRSDDHAQTWQRSNNGLPEVQLSGLSVDVNSPSEQRTLFIAAEKDVYRSTDDGWNWELVLDCNGCWFTAVDQFNGGLVYAGGDGGLYISEAGGMPGSWKQAPGFEGSGNEPYGWEYDPPWTGVHRIRTDPVIEGRIYVAFYGEGGGLYRSDDRGASWVKLWNDDFMNDVAISQDDPQILYTTSSSNLCCGGDPVNSHGVLRSTDGGQTWTQVNEEMPWPFAGPILIDPNDSSLLWAGSPGTGFQWRRFPDVP